MYKNTVSYLKSFSTLSFIIMLSAFAHADYNWELVKDSNGIKVYNRNIDGSDIKEFRAEGVIDAPIGVIFEVMIDVPAGPLWINRCIEARVIKNIEKSSITKNGIHSRDLIYNATGAPFPVSNRDFIIDTDIKWDFKTGSVSINFNGVNDSIIMPRKGYVRMTDITGSWSFKYIDASHTKAVYRVKQNPGGSLPASLVNYTSKDLPYNTITGLRKIVTDKKYIESALRIKK